MARHRRPRHRSSRGKHLTPRQVSRFGWIRDLPDQRDRLFSVPATVLAALPSAVDLRPKCPPVYDQGRIGSCTANAIAAAIQFDRKHNGQKPPFVPSRLFIYYNERSIEHHVGNDSGAQIRDGIKSVHTLGVCPETEWTYDDTPAVSDGGPWPAGAKPSERPPAACYTDAARYEIADYQRLTPTLSQLRGCLAHGYPFVFGFSVYSSFFSNFGTAKQKPKVVIPLPGMSDQQVGGHAVVGVGYEDQKQLFIIRNSWGPANQQAGYFYLPYAYVTDPNLASDFWVIRTVAH